MVKILWRFSSCRFLNKEGVLLIIFVDSIVHFYGARQFSIAFFVCHCLIAFNLLTAALHDGFTEMLLMQTQLFATSAAANIRMALS